jgi:4'-phosphopantetheinyl transferase EntD
VARRPFGRRRIEDDDLEVLVARAIPRGDVPSAAPIPLLLPSFATTHSVAFDVRAEPADAFPDEKLPLSLEHAARIRRLDFAAGRHCACRAIVASALADDPGTLPSRDGGSPAWPPGIVGPITHTRGYAAAAVASTTDALCIGIDSEIVMPLRLAREV